MQVKDLMQNPVTVEKDITLSEAAKLMSEKNIGSIIVTEKGKLKGIITERDVLKNYGKSEKISQVMSSPVYTIAPREQVNTALEIMKEHKIKRLPVTKSEQVVGIISLTDIASHVDELEGDFFF